MREIEAAVVAGVPVDDVTFSEAVELIGEFIAIGRASGRTHQVATVNVDFVVNAVRDRSVMDILQRADLCLADGMPIVWHARLAGIRLRERVAGADLVPRLADLSRQSGWRIVLFGSAESVAETAADMLRRRFPGANVFGISGPMMRDVGAMDDRWVQDIKSFDPDVVCVALGNPKQERWIDAHRSKFDGPVFIGVGGTLDFLVGGRRRAPNWMQKSGLEWVHRAAQEPGRLGRRYVRDALAFGPWLARAAARAVRERLRRSATSGTAVVWPTFTSDADGSVTVDLAGAVLTDRLVSRLVGVARSCHRSGTVLQLTGWSMGMRARLDRLGVVKMFCLGS